MRWFKKPADLPPRRPATSAELQQIASDWTAARARSGSTTALIVVLVAGLTMGITILAGSSPAPRRLGPGVSDAMMWTGFAVGTLALTLLIIRTVKQSRNQRSLNRIILAADPGAAPVVPLLPGDRFGAFVVIAADPDALHIAQAASLLSFRLRRIVVLIGGLTLAAGGIVLIIAILSQSKSQGAALKLVLGMFVLSGGMILYACRRATYQWTIEVRDASPCLVLHQAGLFRASSVVELPAHEINAFVASQGALTVHTKRGTPYELAHLVSGAFRKVTADPLASWRGLCLSSAIAAQLQALFEFKSIDAFKRPGQSQVPADIDPDLSLTPSTAPR